jgi:ATP-dependent DNA helicase RecQ
MRQENIMVYIDALLNADCLRVSAGAYPTISITDLGQRVMREQEQVKLALEAGSAADDDEARILSATASQTYQLFCDGQTVADIARQRNLVVTTIEGHLIECLEAGLAVDVSRLVSESDREQIERSIAEHGLEGGLKPIRESLPESISYNMIRFVVASHAK